MIKYGVVIISGVLIALGYFVGRLTDETVVLNLNITPDTSGMLSVSSKKYYVSNRGDSLSIDFDCLNVKFDRSKIINEHDYIYGIIPSSLKPTQLTDSAFGFYCSSVYTSFNFTERKLTSIGLVAN